MSLDISVDEKLKMYRDSFNSTEQFIAILDNQMSIKDVNRALLDLIGNDTIDLFDMPYWELPLWEHSIEIQNLIMFSFEQIYLGEEVKFETTYLNANDEEKYLEFTIKPVYDEDEEIELLLAMGYDITNVKMAERKLLEVEEELEIFFTTGIDGYMIRKIDVPVELDMKNYIGLFKQTFEKEKAYKYNGAFSNILGIPELFYNGKDLFANGKIYINDDRLYKIFEDAIVNGHSKLETSFINSDKQKIYVEITIKPVIIDNMYKGSFYIVHDVTKEKLYQDELFKMANFDILTSVANRRYFIKQVEKRITSEDFDVGVMCVFDIDNFKSVNDKYGHDVGDIALKNIASTINSKIENMGIFARMGGEEFSAFFMCDLQTAIEIMDDVMNAVRESVIELDKLNVSLKITVSAGMTLVKKDEPFNDFFKRSDNALYEAKNTGRNRYVISKES